MLVEITQYRSISEIKSNTNYTNFKVNHAQIATNITNSYILRNIEDYPTEKQEQTKKREQKNLLNPGCPLYSYCCCYRTFQFPIPKYVKYKVVLFTYAYSPKLQTINCFVNSSFSYNRTVEFGLKNLKEKAKNDGSIIKIGSMDHWDCYTSKDWSRIFS